MDSQSIKTTGMGGYERGYDGAKKVKGRKRHLLVDTQGLVLLAKVHNASVTDRDGIKLLLGLSAGHRLPERLCHLWLDAGYTGQDRGAGWVERTLGWTAETVRHPPKVDPEEVIMRWVREFNKEGLAIDQKRFMPQKGPRPFLPRRWVVERTFSWLGQNRRMSKDYERLPESSEAYIYNSDELPYGEKIGSLMRVFRQFPNGVLRRSVSSEGWLLRTCRNALRP